MWEEQLIEAFSSLIPFEVAFWSRKPLLLLWLLSFWRPNWLALNYSIIIFTPFTLTLFQKCNLCLKNWFCQNFSYLNFAPKFECIFEYFILESINFLTFLAQNVDFDPKLNFPNAKEKVNFNQKKKRKKKTMKTLKKKPWKHKKK